MQITEHVHGLKLPFKSAAVPGKPADRFAYAFLIYGEQICLIDSGVSASYQLISDYLVNTGRSLQEINILAQTHSHPDHIGSSLTIKKESGCRVAAHIDAKPYIEDIDLQYKERPTPTFYDHISGPVVVDVVFEDGDDLNIGNGRTLRIIHTPGHSTDSVCLFWKPEGVLFTGDAIPIAGERPLYEDIFSLINSVQRLKEMEGIKILCQAWSDPQKGDRVYEVLDEALGYMQHLHKKIIKEKAAFASLDTDKLCAQILDNLGFPKVPNVINSVKAHLQLGHIKDLLKA